MNTCTVCHHRERESIEQALRAKLPLRQVAVRFSISKDAARRHLRHAAPQADPLTAEIPPCFCHGDVPFWLQGREWVCGNCEPWDGRLAYWKLSGEPVDECDEYRDTWQMERA